MRQHRNILILAKTLNFTKAAEKAFMSQSAFSKSIAAYERKVGVKIFERTTNSVKITDLGLKIIQEIESFLCEFESFGKNIEDLKSGNSGTISFGTGPYPAQLVLKEIIKNFHLEHPKVSMDITIDHYGNLLNKLYSSEIDFFIADIRNIDKTANLSITPVGGLTIGVFANINHSLVKVNGDSLILAQDLLEYPFASVSLPPFVFNELINALGIGPEKRLSFALKCDDLSFVHEMTKDLSTLCLTSNFLMLDLLKNKDIAKLNVQMSKNRFGSWGLVKLKSRRFSPASSKLASMIVDHIRNVSLLDDKKYGLASNTKLNFQE